MDKHLQRIILIYFFPGRIHGAEDSSSKQPKISTFAASGTLVITQGTLDKLVTDFIVEEGLPFTLVRSEAFKKLVLAGLPGAEFWSGAISDQ